MIADGKDLQPASVLMPARRGGEKEIEEPHFDGWILDGACKSSPIPARLRGSRSCSVNFVILPETPGDFTGASGWTGSTKCSPPKAIALPGGHTSRVVNLRALGDPEKLYEALGLRYTRPQRIVVNIRRAITIYHRRARRPLWLACRGLQLPRRTSGAPRIP